jgi:prevent-host-death family protein
MSYTCVTITTLCQHLADLVNRAADAGECIVLVSRGEPRAAIISMADLRRLEQLNADQPGRESRYACALAMADQVRETIKCWQESYGIAPGDSVEALRRLREERDDQLTGLL